MKQTAVEWLFLMLNNPNRNQDFANKLLEQAKAMEKEQLIMFGAQCMVEVEKESGLGAIKIYEQYYNETYESKTNL